jgi:CRP-like cAMP-binding protein
MNSPHLQIEPLERRLMSLLWTLSDDHGQPVDDGRLLHSPLNQEELAMRLGVSRESVNRALKKLESDRKLRILKPKSFILYKM